MKAVAFLKKKMFKQSSRKFMCTAFSRAVVDVLCLNVLGRRRKRLARLFNMI